MNVGDVPLNSLASRVREFYVQTNPNVSLNVSFQPWNVAVGSFTAPFNCAVMVNAWGKFQIGPNVDCFVVIAASDQFTNLVPASRPPGVFQDGIQNTYTQVVDVPYSFYYPSVAAGTVVNMYARIGLSISSPFYQWNLCLVRCVRT